MWLLQNSTKVWVIIVGGFAIMWYSEEESICFQYYEAVEKLDQKANKCIEHDQE